MSDPSPLPSAQRGPAEVLRTPNPVDVSFEFFPPKTAEMEARLWETVERLAPLAPRFVSVTYGAGGTTRERTHATVARIRRETTLEPAAHLTCVGATREEIDAVARQYWEAGIRHVVALRGDAPADSGSYAPHPGGYGFAADLVDGLKRVHDFEVTVAAYPEMHPEAASAAADLDNLRRKIDAGATRAITQFFFEAETFLRFRDACAKAGIDAPIVPGILPIISWDGARRFAQRCNAYIPPRLEEGFAHAIRDGREDLLALTQCTVLCERLIEEGVDALHFYTLNRPQMTRNVCYALGIVPEVSLQNVA